LRKAPHLRTRFNNNNNNNNALLQLWTNATVDNQLASITRLDRVHYHEREYDGRGFDALNEPHDDRADGLNEGEDVDAECLDMAQVDVVRLVLGRH